MPWRFPENQLAQNIKAFGKAKAKEAEFAPLKSEKTNLAVAENNLAD